MRVIPGTENGRPRIRRGCDRDGGRAPTLCVMADFVLGVLAIIAGLLLCFGGRYVLRLVIPIWGFFVGFGFGAGLVAGFSEDHFLGTVFGWVLGLIFGLVFAVLAYLYYAVAVILVMMSVGFALGSGLIVALGIDWNWVAVLVGLLVGAALGIGSILANVPMLLLTVISAIGGALATVTGLMLVFGAMDTPDFDTKSFADRVDDNWWWYVLFIFFAIAGITLQTMDAAMMRRSVRGGWVEVDETV